MRILIIGGTVFIGRHVVRRLVERGHDVMLFHRGEHEATDLPDVAHMHGDRERIDECAAEFARLAPDAVLDMRAMTGRDATSMLDAIRGATPRIIGVSSVDVYRAYGRLHGSEPGDIEPMLLAEDSPLREKLYPYRGERKDPSFDEYDKIPVERAYMEGAAIAGTIVRLPAVYGEGDYQYRFFMEVQRFDAHRPFMLWQRAQIDWRWPRVYAGNAAEAIVLAVTDARAAGRVYNAPTDEPLTQREWLVEYARIAGWGGEIIPLPDEHLPPHLKQGNNYAQDLVIDSSRIRAELGYKDVSLSTMAFAERSRGRARTRRRSTIRGCSTSRSMTRRSPSTELRHVDGQRRSVLHSPTMTHLPATASVDHVCETLDRDSYAIVEGVLSPDEVQAKRDELIGILRSTPSGRNDFEGFKTQRIYAIFAKTRVFDGPATHPLVLGVLDRMLGHYQLSAPVGISIGPGETAQTLHCDDGVYPLPRPHQEVVMNTMWPLDPFTKANGATRVVPGSHAWTDRRPDASSTVVDAEMPAGSMMFFRGSVYHGGGANTTDRPRLGVIIEYAATWLRPQENHLLAVPREMVRGLPERMQELLGYNIHPPFLGMVDGRHPRKSLLEG